jgi:NAD(P)-dependent dehydrogenase (short-subunit alcohol dehydrogenase family)
MQVVESRYANKVAVVTGGASGIGEAIVRRLIAEGAKVVVGDVNEERMAALGDELGNAFAGVRTDVRDEGDVERMVATAVERFGGLDAGFNVAGLGGGGAIIDMDLDAWQFTVDVCLNGVLLGMKHEARAMRDSGRGGAILNISSLNSLVPMHGGAAYCAAKAGVAMLGSNGALELAQFGIRVNTVSPGLTNTPLIRPFLDVEGVTEAYLERIPANRPGTPDDMASAALYLCSDDAGYVSGINMVVDGAWNTTGYPDLRVFRERMAAQMAR